MDAQGRDPRLPAPNAPAAHRGGMEPALSGAMPIRATLAALADLAWSGEERDALPDVPAEEWWRTCDRGDLLMRCVLVSRRGSPKHRRLIGTAVGCVRKSLQLIQAEPASAAVLERVCSEYNGLQWLGMLDEIDAWAAGEIEATQPLWVPLPWGANFGGRKARAYEVDVQLREALREIIAGKEFAPRPNLAAGRAVHAAAVMVDVARGSHPPAPCPAALNRAAEVVLAAFTTFASAAISAEE